MPRTKADLTELVAIPSVADPRQYPPEECHKAAQWVADAFTEAGLRDVHLAETPDGSHAVIGHRPPPPGAPTVLLYCHYDVQPPLDDKAWTTPPFTLTERDGRWYGRGTADCKGNIVMHLTALRALGEDLPVGLKFVAEGSEEQGTGGLEQYVAQHPEKFLADALLICDTGNAAVGVGTATTTLRGLANVVVTVNTLAGEVHSGMFGGPAPDALAALIQLIASLRDPETGATVVNGLDCEGTWEGVGYDEQQFRTDAGVLDGVRLTGAPEPSPTASGPAPPSPSSASTAHRWSARRRPYRRPPAPASACASRPARTPARPARHSPNTLRRRPLGARR